jgi:hypothetical protein
MSTETEPRSPLMRFFDAFLSEENIRWMLGLGVLLLLGSSIRLVTVHWQEYTPVWKYLILLAYTTVVFVGSQIGWYRLGLRKTGSVLMGLTVLLIPVNFLALHWVQSAGTSIWSDPTHLVLWLGLIVLTLALSTVAAGRIFQHWLRIPQATFFLSYLALSAAGAIVPALPTQWSAGVTLVLWLIFSAGTLKVNRHVFWLIEEHRQPRILGFLPIALLGGQFVGLFALQLATHLPSIGWIGLASALCAMTVLATADAVVAVHQQRTGPMSRPYPWPVVLPLVVGCMLCVAGLGLAATGWPRPTAMLPTAAAAAAGLMIIGRRLDNRAFVWTSLIAALLAYQFSPVYFQTLAATVVKRGAAAVHEPRLPMAFYGITYLPFIACVTLASVLLRRRGETALSQPMQHFAVALTCGLQALACTHQKAQLPVSLLLLVVFVLQAYLYRARWLTIAAGVSWLIAAWGAVAFAGYAFDWVLSDQAIILAMALAAGALLQPGMLFDHLSLRLEQRDRHAARDRATYPLRALGSTTLLVLAVIWLFMLPWQVSTELTLTVSAVIGSLLAAHAMVGPKALLGAGTLLFAMSAVLIHGYHAGMRPMELVNLLEGLLVGQWLLSSALAAAPRLRIARAFREPAEILSLIGLSVLFALRVLPELVLSHAGLQFFLLPNVLMVIWAFDAGRRERLFTHSLAGFFGLLLATTAVAGRFSSSDDPTGLLLIWGTMATAAVPLQLWLASLARRRNLPNGPLAIALGIGAPVVLFGVTIVSLVCMGWHARVAATITLAGIWVLAHRSGNPAYRAAFVGLFNGYLLTSVVAGMSRSGPFITSVSAAEMAHISLPLAALTAFELFIVELPQIRRWLLHDMLARAQTVALWALLAALLMPPLQQLPSGLTLPQAVFAGLSFVLAAAKLMWYSHRSQQTEGTWAGLLLLGIGKCYFAAFGLFDIRAEYTLYLPLAASCVLLLVGRVLARRDGMQVISDPLRVAARWLPLFVPAIVLARLSLDPQPGWAGSNSVALLASAGCCFYFCVETRLNRFGLLAVAIVNMALALLWREVGWSDPLLFTVPIGVSMLLVIEWMKADIPAPFRDPLRYVGALVILIPGLVCMQWPGRLAATIALAGIWFLAHRSGNPAYRVAFVGLFEGYVLTSVVSLMSRSGPYIFSVTADEMAHIALPLAALTAFELFIVELPLIRKWLMHDVLARLQTAALWALLAGLLMPPLQQLQSGLTPAQVLFAGLAFVLATAKLMWYSHRSQQTLGTWAGLLLLVLGGSYFAAFGVLDIRAEWALYVPLVVACVMWTVAYVLSGRPQMGVISEPLRLAARWLPALVPVMALSRHAIDPLPAWRGSNSLALFLSAGFYFCVGIETHRKRYGLLAGAIVNIALALLWRELGWSDPQLFMVPIGASLLLVVEWLKAEIPAPFRDPLRYVGALVILVSPTFDILGGSWLHLCSLMVLSVLVALVAMGLRVRALLYTGTAFLMADLIAMVVRGGIDRPNLLWITGMLLGGAVVALAAFCENHREALLARIRSVAATLEAWE